MILKNRKLINWEETGRNLEEIRLHNEKLRRYTCYYNRTKEGNCEGLNCLKCKKDLDKTISRNELANVFQTTQYVVANWENGKTPPSIEDLMLYCEITELQLDEILIFN